MKTPETDAFWLSFRAATSVASDAHDVVAFGDSAQMADELAALVARGVKRATAGLARDFGPGGPALPKVGDHIVVVDGAGQPVCIWRTTEVRVGPLASVDESFAWDEGEGDRSRDWWLAAHRAFFARQAAREGFVLDEDIETVFERFTVVWPPALADGSASVSLDRASGGAADGGRSGMPARRGR